MKTQRDTLIDFLRGLAILDMILVHFARFFPNIINKIIVYHDIAIDGFILLSGFMIGKHYLPQFLSNKTLITNKLLVRCFKIILIQYILIVIISYPHYLVVNNDFNIQASSIFLIKSFVFYHQIGIMHILPTFIPLFLLSPVLLFFLSKDLGWLMLLLSFLFFVIGQINPYIFNYGDKTIFPIILWQIYFVFGCYLGKISYIKERSVPQNVNLWFYTAWMALLVSLTFKHSLSISAWLTNFKDEHLIIISKFPINFYGLIYGSTLMFFVYTLSVKYWSLIKQNQLILLISLFGRHSLLAFTIHVYFAKTIDIMNYQLNLNSITIYFFILSNIVFSYLVFKRYEFNLLNKSTVSQKIIRWLF